MHITKIFSLGLVIFYPLKHRPFIEISPPLLPNQIMPKSEVFQLFIDSKSRISNKCSHFVYWGTSLVTLRISHGPSAADADHQFNLCPDFEIFLAVKNPCINLLVQSTVTFRL